MKESAFPPNLSSASGGFITWIFAGVAYLPLSCCITSISDSDASHDHYAIRHYRE